MKSKHLLTAIKPRKQTNANFKDKTKAQHMETKQVLKILSLNSYFKTALMTAHFKGH